MNFKHVLALAFASLCAIVFFAYRTSKSPLKPIAVVEPPADFSKVSSSDLNRVIEASFPANATSRELLDTISEKLRRRIERANARPHEALLSFRTPEAARAFANRATQASLKVAGRIEAFNTVCVRFESLDALTRDLLENAADYDQISANFLISAPTTAPQAQARAARSQVPVGNALLTAIGVTSNNTTWGNGVVIAVLDSGVGADSTFGVGRVRTLDIGYGTSPGQDAEAGHATAVASLAAGQSGDALGVAPSASLLSIRVTADDGKSDTFAVAEGILAAVDAGAKIVNISLGGYGTNSVLDSAIEYAFSRGVVIVASAGNDQASQLTWPAADSRVVSVGAVDALGTQVVFSNSGQGLQITAPGLGVEAAWSGNSRVSFSGTSASAPIVSGSIAALMSQDPSLTATQAWSILQSHANEAGAVGVDPDYGNGVLNLGWAMARNDTTQSDTAIASLYYDNASEQLQVVLQNRSAQGVACLDLKIDVNGVSQQHYPVSWLAAGGTSVVSLPISSSQIAAVGQLDLTAELVNPSGLNDRLPANNVRTRTLSSGASRSK